MTIIVFMPGDTTTITGGSTMLQLMQQANGELGLSVPTAVASSSAADTIQQLALLNSIGNELAREYQWENLNKVHLITVLVSTITGDTTLESANITNASSIALLDTTYQIVGTGIPTATYINAAPSGTTIVMNKVATTTATGTTFTLTKVRYTMPSDFDRIIDDTQWDQSKHWKMLGPETAQQWEWLTNGYISTGPRVRFRIFGGYFQIWPAIGTTDVLGFEYVSRGWAISLSSVIQSSFTADTDTCIFPDRLMVLGLKLKYFEAKGFDTTAIYRDYIKQKDIAFANDSGSPTLSFAPRISSALVGWNNIPDSEYGS